MASDILRKTWVSPVVAVLFAAVAVTGVLMVFHVRLPFMHGLHKWGGLAFAIAGAIHLIINWRTFLAYFQERAAVVSLVAAALICLGLMCLGGGGGPDHHGGPHGFPFGQGGPPQ